jgi:hypothetical protein
MGVWASGRLGVGKDPQAPRFSITPSPLVLNIRFSNASRPGLCGRYAPGEPRVTHGRSEDQEPGTGRSGMVTVFTSGLAGRR